MKESRDRPRRPLLARHSRIVLFFMACVLLVLIAVFVCLQVFMTAKTVHVQNDTVYETSELMQALDFSVGDSLLRLREEEWSRDIPLQYPYVSSVTVDSSPFSGVTVTFHAARPLIALESNGRYVYLDKSLKVLGIVDNPDADLLFLYGISPETVTPGYSLDENEDLEISVLKELLRELERYSWLEKVTFVDFSKVYNIRFCLQNTVTVQLGTSEDLDKKMSAAHYVYSDNDATRKADINVKNYKNPRYALVE